MNPLFAWPTFFGASRNPGETGARGEGGLPQKRCRGHGGNSNAHTVQGQIGSGIIAALRSGAAEFFSADFAGLNLTTR
jgi:hypothetical protein